jgi:hypothetical protein
MNRDRLKVVEERQTPTEGVILSGKKDHNWTGLWRDPTGRRRSNALRQKDRGNELPSRIQVT